MSRAIVNVTSDKCYENREWLWGYRENDALGGYDPYSASKGCAEIVTGCWRNSFFNLNEYGRTHETLLASARAGNVIGGGDWAADRLIPDIMRAIHRNEKVKIRNPQATRPWQHVLEPLSGYLLLGQKLLEGRKEFAEAWNFGPSDEENASVGEIVEQVRKAWPKMDYEIQHNPGQPHEAGLLKLDCSKARAQLKWMPVWTGKSTVEKTALWYRTYYEAGGIQSLENLQRYLNDAKSKHIIWTARMKFTETRLQGAFVITPDRIEDERGFFARTFCRREFEEHGLNPNLVQCNISFNKKKGTLRGMHYQVAPHEEAKLVRCTSGAIYDVIIDLRPVSPTFKQWFAAELSGENHQLLYVPEGFAHGYQTLMPQTEVSYQVSEFYNPASERGIRWDDPTTGVTWPLPVTLMSQKDRNYPLVK